MKTTYNDYDTTVALLVSAMTEPTHSRSSSSLASGYPLGYHDAIWHPRARIQDIIKTYPHLNI
jgi:hypothetical protein